MRTTSGAVARTCGFSSREKRLHALPHWLPLGSRNRSPARSTLLSDLSSNPPSTIRLASPMARCASCTAGPASLSPASMSTASWTGAHTSIPRSCIRMQAIRSISAPLACIGKFFSVDVFVLASTKSGQPKVATMCFLRRAVSATACDHSQKRRYVRRCSIRSSAACASERPIR